MLSAINSGQGRNFHLTKFGNYCINKKWLILFLSTSINMLIFTNRVWTFIAVRIVHLQLPTRRSSFATCPAASEYSLDSICRVRQSQIQITSPRRSLKVACTYHKPVRYLLFTQSEAKRLPGRVPSDCASPCYC